MRKMLVIILAAMAAHAQAGTVATMANTAGGLISFTDVECPVGIGGGHVAISTNDSGNVIYGCWKFNKIDTVWTLWITQSQKELREYPTTDIVFNQNWKPSK